MTQDPQQAKAPTLRSARSLNWMIAAVVIAAVVPFVYTLTFDFAYDDQWTIVDNQFLKLPLDKLLRLLRLGRAMPDVDRPSMVLSMWLDRTVFGLHAWGFHAHSVVIYAMVCVLAFFSIFVITKNRKTALLASVLFACMPLHVEPVAAINYREDLISTLWTLFAFVLVTWPGAKHDWTRASLVGASILLGLGAKETTLAIFLLVPLAAAAMNADRIWWKTREKTWTALLVAIVIWGSWRQTVALGGGDAPRSDAPLLERLTQLGPYWGWALLEGLAPLKATFVYNAVPRSSLNFIWLAPFVALIAFALRHRRAAWAQAVLWMFVTLIVTSPLVGPVNVRADRYMLMPSVGAALLWALTLQRVATRASWASRTKQGALIAALVLMAGAAAAQSHAWKDELTFWRAATQDNPRHSKAWAGLAFAYRKQGHIAEARDAIETSLSLDATYAPARMVDIYVRLERNQREDALARLDRLEREHPDTRGVAQARKCAALPQAQMHACLNGQLPRSATQ